MDSHKPKLEREMRTLRTTCYRPVQEVGEEHRGQTEPKLLIGTPVLLQGRSCHFYSFVKV